MNEGISLHIGLNQVDPVHYQGWSGPLAACEFDAMDMDKIANKQGFRTTRLLTAAATADAVLNAIHAAARILTTGDTFLITCSSHGGQIEDISDEENDGLDETWCLFDRQLIDDELHQSFGAFRKGVRIVMFSDSCHSGTMARAAEITDAFGPMKTQSSIARLMPPEVASRVLNDSRDLYTSIKKRTRQTPLATIDASVLLISGCQDHQFSYDGDRNGAFTGALRKVWDKGKFRGSYRALHKQVLNHLPPYQSPNLFLTGAHDPGFISANALELKRTVGAYKAAAPRSTPEALWGDELPGLDRWRILPATPESSDISRARDVSKIPESIDDLPQATNRVYDLTVTGAAELGIPVAGSVSGGGSRRVVILERAAFVEIETQDGGMEQWGYAIRYCVTVSKFEASMKLTLPFLAASAQMGSIEAQWMMQVVGLSGPQIDQSTITPTDLNVETFVLAKQSLEKLINAVRDAGTTFHPSRLAKYLPEDQRLLNYRKAVGTTIALDKIAEGKTLSRAMSRLTDPVVIDGLREVYSEFLGSGGTGDVDIQSKIIAQQLIGRVSVRY